jgi:uncharacterized membrane protein (UPF0127 family)
MAFCSRPPCYPVVTARDSTRRSYLRAAGGVFAGVALAGCSGDETPRPSDTPSNSGGAASTVTVTRGTDDGTTTDGATTTAPIHPGHDYETTEVRVETPEGDLLGSVIAAIADTSELRYLGLSDTDSMPEDRGMLFVYDEVQDLTFVMRRMSFGIDIVYADDEGVITTIHHAPEPGPGEDGNEQRYPGRGQYVLEVNLDWTTRHGVEEGDRVEFSL